MSWPPYPPQGQEPGWPQPGWPPQGPPREPIIPPQFVGQNVVDPIRYIQRLYTLWKIRPVPIHTNVPNFPQQALGLYDGQAIYFPTRTTYEIVAKHEFLHHAGNVEHRNPLAYVKEEHEVRTYTVNPAVSWCLTCTRAAGLADE